MKHHLSWRRRLLSMLLALAMVATVVPATAGAIGAEDTGEFLNGPYLMTPKSDSMVVVWELDEPVKSTITYGTGADDMQTVDVPVEEGAEYKGEAMHMYRARLTGLKPGTTYSYTVATEDGQTMEGHFRTLSENPDEVRFVVVSDTHRFETAEQVSEAIEAFDPDFILHTGDMVEGTGSQKDQFSYWFRNVGSFLHNVPVIYNSGNHDYGVYFDEYVTKVQKEQYHSNETGRNVSFSYGSVHFAMVDSNPWSLFELNSSAGGQVDPSTKAVVDESLNWLKDDLASDAAKTADFRVLTMHHPYDDGLTRKYIPSIAEEGNVNIMFSGHTHLYFRYASANPERGTNTLYVTQGDARIGDGKIDTGKADQRLDDNYPNLLATGKGDMLEVTVKDGKMTYSNIGMKGDTEEVYETVSLSKDGQQLAYDNISITPDSIQSGDKVTVSAKVTNIGTGLAAARMCINDNGNKRWLYQFGQAGKERVVALEPGESAELSAQLELTELGKHTLEFAGYTRAVNVTFREATYVYNNLRTKLGDGEVSDPNSDLLCVKADVKNIGNEVGTATATLLVNDKEIESKPVHLEAGQTRSVEFRYTFPAGGTYTVKIGSSAEKKVTVLGSIQGTPIVRDKSGLGNDGIIRGNPTLVKYDGGWGLSLDGVDDYVEIPDNRNYVIDNGVTGMVWANVDRLAMGDEWDHNPLLMKGASISYGTNYLFRMAVRKTGMVTYGIGFDNDNGEYFWNDDESIEGAGVQLGNWVQYTGGFDRATGGTSWENTKLSGQIDAPDFDSVIKNWEGKSMYSGFSFHRHLLSNRGRGKTHTMLTGDIGQIRFYNAKLSEESNKTIYSNPSDKGPQGENLVVWLDFAPENIETDGMHVTEWRPVIGNLKEFSYETEITGAASAKAVIEISDDGETVKASREVDLANGKGTLDLTELGRAKYVRVCSRLHSSVTEDATDVPVLKSYTVVAGNCNTWSTLADWNRGTFTGAAGYESDDVFNDYANDYDDYSGDADVSEIPVGSDVAKDHWAYPYIQKLIEQDVLHGDSGTGNIRPNDPISREEIAAALLNALDIPVDKTGEIAAGDKSSEWAKDVLATAKAYGVMVGDEKGHMNGQLNAKRAEFAAMIVNVTGIKAADTADLKKFSDSTSVPKWARNSMTAMVEKGILSGYPDNTLRPNAPITRAEAATLIQKVISNNW